ncbi:poly-beta-1,6-N-acetyl-D-glucosamine N-deacetylase PgaB [Tatumella sp. JGM118]|uniref:Poly-beta-1,6-N-acetyl-D-glucosamine N-deacetylase PgaB n=1 Tax=Tatumella terrea TaxID=419007 RepID=A0ABW1W2G5_9GAMM|nr:poly-beta-1,6-N-acetyl-D-glucosamine N-deacetylase PgaB [Tatumella sp. JGM118]MBS0909962.1 poly-beta-1,6-N-acetyl-D-glucosamine N-deacetylase PgaB [Tatumella sp. JGM118]
MINVKKFLLLLTVSSALLGGSATAAPVQFTPPSERSHPESQQPWPANSFLTIAYHDVEDGGADQRYLAVRTSALIEQMNWLRDNGYHPVSIRQILDAHDNKRPLPPKAVLLSFDDGYRSFYDRVWPLLKAWNWPALWAPVGSWISTPADKAIDFGGLKTPREKFATWQMVKEVSDSGLVDIGSHTWDAHFGLTANPEGSLEPAMTTRRYHPQTKTYETEAQFQQRISLDIDKVTRKIRQVTGKTPEVLVWPYGAESGMSFRLAQQQGYKMAFTLSEGLGNAARLNSIPRVLISGNPSLQSFVSAISETRNQSAVRMVQVDLDYIYDPNPAQQQKNIDQLIQRIYDMRVSHVFLQAFADPKGDGLVRSLYFPNRHLPVRADLFNFVSWQLQNRANVKVYAWMPVLSFDLDKTIPRVTAWSDKKGLAKTEADQYQRLSPWSPAARQQITEIYQDLAAHASFSGILFHDDALLSDYEDASPPALAAYQNAGFGRDIPAIRQSPVEFQRWTEYKSRTLTDFTLSLLQAVRAIRGPQIESARNIYAEPVLNPQSESWYAQNLSQFLAAYRWTVPMAMPAMENIPVDQQSLWLQRLVEKVQSIPGAKDKTIIELQSVDWRQPPQKQTLTDQTLADWMKQLQLLGVKNYGYYPDNFLRNQPGMSVIRPYISSAWYPAHD